MKIIDKILGTIEDRIELLRHGIIIKRFQAYEIIDGEKVIPDTHDLAMLLREKRMKKKGEKK